MLNGDMHKQIQRKEELHRLTERLEKTAAGYGMEIGSDKSKILVNIIKPRPSTNIWMSGKTPEEAKTEHQ